MISRRGTLSAATLAAEVIEASDAHARAKSGYTRIDPVLIAERAGVCVMSRPLEKLLGAFLGQDSPGILLNSERPVGMVHMTCAHELGHFFLGHGATADAHLSYERDAEPFEQEANQFAYSLLAPEWLLVKVMKARKWTRASLTDEQIVYQLSLRLGLSYQAMVWTLSRMKYIDARATNRLVKIQPAVLKGRLLSQDATLSDKQDVWRLGPEDKDSILEPRPDDRLVIDLPSHTAAGYLWSPSEAADLGFTLQPQTINGERESLEPSEIVVGAPATLRYELLMDEAAYTRSTSPTVIELRETRPWDLDSRIDVLALQAQPEVRTTGLSPGSKAMIFKGMQPE